MQRANCLRIMSEFTRKLERSRRLELLQSRLSYRSKSWNEKRAPPRDVGAGNHGALLSLQSDPRLLRESGGSYLKYVNLSQIQHLALKPNGSDRRCSLFDDHEETTNGDGFSSVVISATTTVDLPPLFPLRLRREK